MHGTTVKEKNQPYSDIVNTVSHTAGKQSPVSDKSITKK